jgi:hypothetical protein
LDTFNRADGVIGTNWTFDTSSYKITGNQLVATSGGMIFWKAASFGPEQEAYITFVNIDAAATNMDLLLKSQTTSKDSFLEVGYNPVKKIILVESYTKAQGYLTYGPNIPVTFSNGDQLGVRVSADGKVNTYKNGVSLGVRDISAWSNYTNGGYWPFIVGWYSEYHLRQLRRRYINIRNPHLYSDNCLLTNQYADHDENTLFDYDQHIRTNRNEYADNEGN